MAKKEQLMLDSGALASSDEGEISLKSKKNEILDAYQKLLNQIKESKQVSHQEVKKKQDEDRVMAKAYEYNSERIIGNIADVKSQIGGSLDQLEQRLVAEYRRLSELQDAIKLETTKLEDLRQITLDVDTLAAILQAQKAYQSRFEQLNAQETKEFEQAMQEKRAAWKKEQEEVELERKEHAAKTHKERMREDEEYRYTLQLERKKDADAYQLKETALEHELAERKAKVLQELAERERTVVLSEEELQELRGRVASFQKELEGAVIAAETRLRERLEREHKHQIDLTTVELAGDRKLNSQTIASLRDKIKEQENLIQQLTQKANDAGLQVQAIALKALDGSALRYTGGYEETKRLAQSER